MRRWCLFTLLWGGAAECALAGGGTVPAPRYGDLPLLFERHGESFLARGPRQCWWLEGAGTVRTRVSGDIAGMRLVGAVRPVLPQGRTPQSTAVAYIKPGAPAGHPDVFREVWYPDIYPGIDLIYYGTQARLGYDFVIAPGARADAIGVVFDSARRLWIDTAGALHIETASGLWRQAPLVAYQRSPEGIRPVSARYVLRDHTVRFAIGRYDPSRPLVFDPAIAYGTYLGGAESDYGYAIAVDSQGCVYVAGETASASLAAGAPFQADLAGDRDVFVTKLNAAGTAIIYSTYIGGSNRDTPRGLAVDAAGNALVTGFTYSPDFPVTTGALRGTAHSGVEGFVLQLNAGGTALRYATFLGGTRANYPAAIAVDAAGTVYVAGYTDSPDFPVTANALQKTFAGGGYDAFLAALNSAGNALVYSTYLGGQGNDTASAIALDSGGNVYLTGATESADFPVRNPLFPRSIAADAFVARLDNSGQLVFSTFLGGTGADQGNAVAVDSAGNVYVAGATQSINFPVTQNAYSAVNRGGYDAFLAKLDASGHTLLYATCLGGTGEDTALGIAILSSGFVAIAGHTTSTDFPLVAAPGTRYGGQGDVFASTLSFQNQAVGLVSSTYLGGPENDCLSGLAADAAGNLYLTGWTSGGWEFPAGSSQPVQGNLDAFVLKLLAPAAPNCTAAATAVAFPKWALFASTADVVLTCTGGTAGTALTSDIQVTFDAPVWPRARLRLQVQGQEVALAESLSGAAVVFRNVSIPEPGPDALVTLRITGIQVQGPFTAGGQIRAVTAAGALPVGGATQVVASIQEGAVQWQSAILARAAPSGGCAAPAPASSFTAADAQVVLWFQVAGAAAGDIARVEWLAPDASTSRGFTWSPLASSGAVCLWDSLAVAGAQAAGHTGPWTLHVYWNGFALASLGFTLAPASQPRWLIWQNDSSRQVTANYLGGSGALTFQGWDWLKAEGSPGWRVAGAGDFDGNGIPDLVWQEEATARVTVNYYAGPAIIGWAYLNAGYNVGWKVVAITDFDRNGVPDLVWQNQSTGQVTVNYYAISGGLPVISGWAWLNSAQNPGWRVTGAADFNGDGTPDLIWQNASTGQVTVNYYGFSGGLPAITGWAWLNTALNPGWLVAGAADFNSDGIPDLVWLDQSTRQATVNNYGYSSGQPVIVNWAWLPLSGTGGWKIAAVL